MICRLRRIISNGKMGIIKPPMSQEFIFLKETKPLKSNGRMAKNIRYVTDEATKQLEEEVLELCSLSY
jgi:hypothetical protein